MKKCSRARKALIVELCLEVFRAYCLGFGLMWCLVEEQITGLFQVDRFSKEPLAGFTYI